MNIHKTYSVRMHQLMEFSAIVGLWFLLKAILDVYIWRFSGPVALAFMLVFLFFYLRKSGRTLSWIGLISLTSMKGWLLLFPQILLVIIIMVATGAGITLLGEAMGFEFMKPDILAAENRFGDLAGNTPQYILWIIIIWFAGPAEELFFRGFMIGQLREALGTARWATFLSVVIPAFCFGMGHMYYQGLRGLFVTGGVAIMLGILYVLFKRNIWPLAVGHAAANSLMFTAMYMQWDF